MTIYSQGKSARPQSFHVSATTEDVAATLYTCPANCRAEVTMLLIVNNNGNTTVHVTWEDANNPSAPSDLSASILGSKNMVQGDYVLFSGSTLVLEPGDSIAITPSGQATPHIDGVCTVTETFIPVG
jgi:archaellum component FlaF (FlaF/FlaG flagellin family)